jgi:hypothetical protein
MTLAHVSEKVARGLALLTDEQVSQIDLVRLDMGDATRCVLAQLFGNFCSDEANAFKDEHGLNGSRSTGGDSVVSHGFDTWVFGDESYTSADLTTEWIRQVSARREALVSA